MIFATGEVAAARALARLRRVIDLLDGSLLLVLALRVRIARAAANLKRAARRPMRDASREAKVRARAAALGDRLGLPPDAAPRAIELAIELAQREQGIVPDLDQGGPARFPRMMPSMNPDSASGRAPTRLLRLLPPPDRLAPLLRALPRSAQRQLLEGAMARVLAGPIAEGALDFMTDRRLGIVVTDLGLHWVVELESGRLRVVEEPPQACVRGTATDLLLLASRLEDADTLFFQRRLVLSGDTELGLTVRNLLEALPWESVPLALRIALNRGARLASAARQAHRARN